MERKAVGRAIALMLAHLDYRNLLKIKRYMRDRHGVLIAKPTEIAECLLELMPIDDAIDELEEILA